MLDNANALKANAAQPENALLKKAIQMGSSIVKKSDGTFTGKPIEKAQNLAEKTDNLRAGRYQKSLKLMEKKLSSD